MYWKMLWAVIKHKWYIILSAKRVGLKWWMLLGHDLSKFSRVEFCAYAKQFYASGGTPGDATGHTSSAYDIAWQHHQDHNLHHPEHWAVQPPPCILPMPNQFVQEMVADWLAASKTHTGSWDMSQWLSKNIGRFQFHDDTKDRLRNVLEDIGIRVIL